jgi:putative ABC transport system permease protein
VAWQDFIRLTLGSIFFRRMRSFLTTLGIAVGIAAVVMLTSLGEGVHSYVLGQFTQFGTNLLQINPGKTSTFGMSGAIISTIRPLTLEDSLALKRIPGVEAVEPVVQGNVKVEYGARSRRTMVFGTGSSVPEVWKMNVSIGNFLPDDDPRTARALAVLGSKLQQELFPGKNPLGEYVRVGGERYRVIGVMGSKGTVVGFDLDDSIFIPAGRALAMFDRESLMEIDVLYQAGLDGDTMAKRISDLLERRHGREDFTVITQAEMLKVLDSVLGILTLAVGAIGSISLLVGAIGILTIMTIAVNERISEIGLLRALGASQSQILTLFLGEATLLSGLGGFSGLVLGILGVLLINLLAPVIPSRVAWQYVLLAELIAIIIGLAAGVIPALRAARLDPVEVLHEE